MHAGRPEPSDFTLKEVVYYHAGRDRLQATSQGPVYEAAGVVDPPKLVAAAAVGPGVIVEIHFREAL